MRNQKRVTMETVITVRAITPDDMPTIRAWAEARGGELFEPCLSPNGFLAVKDDVPVMAAWAALLFDVPIVQIDGIVAAPGFKAGVLRAAWRSLESVILTWVQKINESGGYNYKFLRAFTNSRLAAISGWQVQPEITTICRHVV